MKRSIIALSLILILVLSLSSCFGGNLQQEYKTLNELASNLTDVSSITIRTTSPDSHIASDSYSYRPDGTYFYQSARLNGFTSNGDGYDIPDEYFEIDEKTLSVDEFDALDLVPTFNFSSTALANGVVHTGSLTADIINTTEFFGKELDVTNVQLTVYYNTTAINSITINYTSDIGNNVIITYTFQ